MVLLTNCTFDGIVYNPLQVMQEILAIKPDICFLWDEAWYAFATAVPWARQRTAMVAADTLDPEARLTGIRRAVRRTGASRWPAWTRADWAAHRLLPDPEHGRVRVYATHSTHKSLSALRQASMIHIRDQDFDRLTREQFGEAFLTHTSTSPNQQLLASLDLARRQVDIEGFQLVRSAYTMALAFRTDGQHRPGYQQLVPHPGPADLVPEQFRTSGARSYQQDADGVLDGWNEAWQDRPVRAGPDPSHPVHRGHRHERLRVPGRRPHATVRHPDQQDLDQQRAADLHHRRHLVQRPLPARRAAPHRRTASTGTPSTAGPADRALQHRRKIEKITLRPAAAAELQRLRLRVQARPPPPDGDMRAAFYAGYKETDREYILLGARHDGRRRQTLVSTASSSPIHPDSRSWYPARSSRTTSSTSSPGRRQGDPRLPPRTGAVRVHRCSGRTPRIASACCRCRHRCNRPDLGGGIDARRVETTTVDECHYGADRLRRDVGLR